MAAAPFAEPEHSKLLEPELQAKKFMTTTAVEEATAFVIAVPTPLISDKDGGINT